VVRMVVLMRKQPLCSGLKVGSIEMRPVTPRCNNDYRHVPDAASSRPRAYCGVICIDTDAALAAERLVSRW